MGTSSSIAVQHENGTVSSVYCHWDGGIEHNGKLLVEHYYTQELAEALVTGGSISSLGKRIAPASAGHNFDNPEKDVTVFYARDRNENLVIKKFLNMRYYLQDQAECEYNYIFKDNNWWLVNLEKGTFESVFWMVADKATD